MNGFPHFDQFLTVADRDGALAETSSRAEAALSRRGLLGVTLGAVGAIVFGKTSVAEAAADLPASDVDILNYALVLEYLQASFYTEAERSGALSGATARAARVVGATERAHVNAFRHLLGSRAVARPTFDFQGVTEQQRAFLKTAVALEDLAVEAYKGQAPKAAVQCCPGSGRRHPLGRGATCSLDARAVRDHTGRECVRSAGFAGEDQPDRRLHPFHRVQAADESEKQAPLHRLM